MTEEAGKAKTSGRLGAMAGYISLFVAGLSLVTALYQGYLNTKYIEIIQKNVVRGEYMRTCKDIIDAYFQIKLRVALLAMGGPNSADREAEAANAVNHFAALGTYLANMQGEEARVRYTQLSRVLSDVVNRGKSVKADEVDKLFGPADELFTGMNNDCVRTANTQI